MNSDHGGRQSAEPAGAGGRGTAAKPPALLAIDSVAKTYQVARTGESVEALLPVTIDIRRGECLAIVGPSGCGKSTLLKMIAGIDTPTSGVIRLNDRPVTKPGPDRAMVFQQYVLFPWKTVRGNLRFGMRAIGLSKQEQERRVSELLRRVGLAGFAEKYPHELSGGMQQRCALARALAVDPEVLLMDEPLASVDAQTRILLQQEILDVWGQDRPQAERKAMVYITHDIEEAVYLADRILVMTARPGQIKEVIDCDLARPRVFETRTTEDFRVLVKRVWDLIRDELTVL